MKIIYSAGNRIGANTQLTRFLDNIDKTKHQIKIAAYVKSSYLLSDIDWTLNAIWKNIPNNHILNLHSSKYKYQIINELLNDVAEFNPDLIICDYEHIFSFIAKEMNVELWYCSPLLLAEGINWNINNKMNYSYFVSLENIRKISIFPIANKYLIYSPFCDIKNPPELHHSMDDDWNPIHKYEWVRPYFYKQKSNIHIEEIKRSIKLNNILKYIDMKKIYFTDGNTDNISDAIYNKKNIIISPSLNNREALLNSILLDKYKIGKDIGQVELMNEFALEEIENSISYNFNKIKLIDSKTKQLHEMIDDFKIDQPS